MSILEAVRAKNVPKVRELIANTQFSHFEGIRAFVEAAQEGELEIVKLFIDGGVDVNQEVPLQFRFALYS